MGHPSEDLVVTASVTIPAADLHERFTPSGGPGGQHANKASTRVEIRLDLATCGGLRTFERSRLIERLGTEVRISVDQERSQTRNRALARQRLAARLRSALAVRRSRTPTRPTRGSQQRRVQAKRQRSQTKRDRRWPTRDD